LESRTVSILGLMEPCGLWQLAQPSRMAACSKMTGLVCSRWHWAQLSFKRDIASPPAGFMISWPCGSWHWTQFIFALDDGMVLRQVKFRLDVQMALETGGRILAGIDNKFQASAARRDVFAARAVARFAAGLAGPVRAGQMQARVGTGRKGARDALVAIRAGFVADKVAPSICSGATTVTVHRGARIHQSDYKTAEAPY
jgi:hypothetical protein